MNEQHFQTSWKQLNLQYELKRGVASDDITYYLNLYLASVIFSFAYLNLKYTGTY